MKWLRRFFDMLPSRGEGGLLEVQHMRGKWRVIYPDGVYSMPFYYDTACKYSRIFGGRVIHIDDTPTERRAEG